MRTWCALMVLASACGPTKGSFRFTGAGLPEAFENWRRTATPKTRATIDALDNDPSLLIHVLRGRIKKRKTRGAWTSVAGSQDAIEQCILHPPVDGVRWNRNFDVVWDEEQQRAMALELGLPSPVEALLQHEIMGHIIPVLLNPALATRSVEDAEPEAIRQENEYRRHVGLPLVPEPKAVRRNRP